MSLSSFEEKLLMEFFVTGKENEVFDFPLSSDADLKLQQIDALKRLCRDGYIRTVSSIISSPVHIILTSKGRDYIQNY